MMTKNVTAFGESQPGGMKSALFTHKGDGRLAKRGKLKHDLARPEPYLGNVSSYSPWLEPFARSRVNSVNHSCQNGSVP
jgi:hypothetical protein